MSSVLVHCFLRQSLCVPTILEHSSVTSSSGVPPNAPWQASMANERAFQIRKCLIPTKFNAGKIRVIKGRRRMISVVLRAVLTTDPTFKLAGKFILDENSELQISIGTSTQGSSFKINIQVKNSRDSLILHWGGICHGKKKWILPSCQPDGTKIYKNRALRTPLMKSGLESCVKIEIDDPEIQAIEFLIFDEKQNKWFKDNGENFCVQLKEELSPNVLVPEEFLRHERKEKQNYTPEQEKVEYEVSPIGQLEEIASAVPIGEVEQQAKLTKSDDNSKAEEFYVLENMSMIPDDLVQVQAYIRWKRVGRPNYSPDQQLKEFEEARKELQIELDKDGSLDEIQKKLTKGDIQARVSKQLQNKRYFTVERIQRKKRNLMELLTEYATESVKQKLSIPSNDPTTVEIFLNAKVEQDGGPILNKSTFKLGNEELLVLVTKPFGKTKVYLATDLKGPLTLHWGVSRKPGEWAAPPQSALPHGSVLLDSASQTELVERYYGDPPCQVKFVEIEIGEENFVGIPFVLLSGRKWRKNNGSDFYVDFGLGAGKLKQGESDGKGIAKDLLDKIAEKESQAQKSFMHRFNIASDLIEWAKDAGELGLAGIFVWMRFMATRQLIWNKNYNVKPREISRAQDRFTDSLQNIYKSYPQYQEILRMILTTVGRGGEGDVGQRIRDEILVIQRKNNCKGGMMEEWHQKLHNNTSPDDVIICQALINYIKSDLDISSYWKTLNSNGITKERLLSYDRAIHSEPNFRRDQKDGLLLDLQNYMRTLKAVHSGADLESAIGNCMGYRAKGRGFMVGVQINPVAGLPSGFPELLQFVLDHVEDKNIEPFLEGLLEAREELRPLLRKPHDRLRDLLFLDISLDSMVRTAIERGYEELNNDGPQKMMYFITLVLENLSLSSDNNRDLIYCLKGWNHALYMFRAGDDGWALYAKSFLDRSRLALACKAEQYEQLLQPSAKYLGSLLGVDQWAVNIFTEEVIRAESAASLSSLLHRLDPFLRRSANLGSWQVISPIETIGYVEVVDELLAVQNKSYGRPTILVAKSVKGEEEIPAGTVAVLTSDLPDVLSHVSVRARNSKVCFATCFDPDILSDLRVNEGKLLQLEPTSADIFYSEVKDSELSETSSTNLKECGPSPSLTLVRKHFCGRYAISSEEFTREMVGAKSCNIAHLEGKAPSWVGIPTSVALPFGVFEKVLLHSSNQAVADTLETLKKRLKEGEFSTLGPIREAVLQLAAPPQLVQELKNKMQSSRIPWPGDEGEHRWAQAWMAIKKVWASKWNERAFFSTRKAKLDHNSLCMAVLVQEIINADYAFVIHTTNPSSGDSSEIYAEVVKGLGESLVEAYPDRALSFSCKKSDLNSPRLLGYPSKPIGLFIRQSIIFRSDSNGEDLEGYAGAGLYDSVPMDDEEKVVVDYSLDPLIIDDNFRQSILSSIARTGSAIEELYGSPQDIEGVVKDGKIYVVQTRPQM
ncbi:alpha-glucan water dikinase, chloroplastic-like isoform X2 [Telopea speciosissima]|uniref:alpha-glucan water dikinase, chloroplastic-like isoform X2 n=1 Tax=Telopea speciosissima TaxID=54955 RepID=UPI001CC4923F|nr:alpha-glucan water dikinase, chloroplastic-like isoform X2 [Telopea speciosissima]